MRWLLPALALAVGCSTPSEARDPLAGVIFHDAAGDDGGVSCASSCALPDPPGANYVDPEDIEAWLEIWSQEPVGEATESLEALLFHGPATRAALDAGASLDSERLMYLARELSRAARIEMRLVDGQGVERGTLSALVPLVEKQHLVFAGTGSPGHLETGGKVKRVGLGHLWSRW